MGPGPGFSFKTGPDQPIIKSGADLWAFEVTWDSERVNWAIKGLDGVYGPFKFLYINWNKEKPLGPAQCLHRVSSSRPCFVQYFLNLTWLHQPNIIVSFDNLLNSWWLNTNWAEIQQQQQQQLSHLSQVFGVGYMNQKRITSERAHRSAFSTHSYQAICLHYDLSPLYLIVLPPSMFSSVSLALF